MMVVAFLAASLGGPGEAGDDATSASVESAPAASASAAGVEPLPPAPEASTGEQAEAVPPGASEATAVPGGSAGAPAGSHPANVLQLPASVSSALVFDLQANRMHLFEENGERSSPVGDYFVAVGKNGIEKRREGDEKTPVGIYFISSYIPGDTLPAIYGVGAFPLDYPNAWDRRLGRTGSGIWIHGTDKDEDSLLPQSSRGCLTLHNSDFQTMARLVRIQLTPVIVSDAVSWTDPQVLEAERASLAAAVETWRRDWESLDTDAYLRHYSSDFRTDSMDLAAWTAHKRRVNAYKSYIQVDVDDVGIYGYPGERELFLVTFEQRYRSNNFQGRKWKHQYWRREAGDWRIVHESGR